MGSQLTIQIITPERIVYEGEAKGITLPSATGELTILPDHEPLLTLLKSGEIALHLPEGRRHMAVHSGFVDISKNRVRLLTDAAELEEEVDERRAHEALEKARKAKEEAADSVTQADALAAMERAIARLRLAERKKNRHRA